jgi:hypothetical protein
MLVKNTPAYYSKTQNTQKALYTQIQEKSFFDEMRRHKHSLSANNSIKLFDDPAK